MVKLFSYIIAFCLLIKMWGFMTLFFIGLMIGVLYLIFNPLILKGRDMW